MELGDLADLEFEVEMLSQDAVKVWPGTSLQIENWGGGRSLRGR